MSGGAEAIQTALSTTKAAASANVAPEVVSIPVSSIRTDRGTQIREELDGQTLKRYGEAYDRHEEFPPIDVFREERSDDVYVLVDGFHRLEVQNLKGSKIVRARVHTGSLRDARLFACGANHTHGLPLSNVEKRRAVETVLADPEWSKKTSREIAKLCHVSHTFVQTVQRQLAGNVSNEQLTTEVADSAKGSPHACETRAPAGAPHQRPAPTTVAAEGEFANNGVDLGSEYLGRFEERPESRQGASADANHAGEQQALVHTRVHSLNADAGLRDGDDLLLRAVASGEGAVAVVSADVLREWLVAGSCGHVRVKLDFRPGVGLCVRLSPGTSAVAKDEETGRAA
ncbi:MAG: ParB N-terminal domain-containing protein [Labilithrix sp.]|nr:ParB N-terminal domain-containing protein [Labilithrix sp.]